MKKVINAFISMLVLMLAACTSEEVRVENPEQGLSSHLRTADEAVAIAQNLYQARHNSRANVAVANVAVIGSSASRASADTLIYAVNFADNQGFTLVSAAKSGEAVIGYSDEGQYREDEVAENTNFSYYMEAAKNYVEGNVVVGPWVPMPDPSAPTKTVETIQPRVSVNYGQVYPEGEYFSNKLAGCAQTAVAMVCSFLEWPVIMDYKCDDINVSFEFLNWTEIKKHVTSSNFSPVNGTASHQCTATLEAHYALARLCREIGYLSDADCSNPKKTTTKVPHMINAINTLFTTTNYIKIGELSSYAKGVLYETLNKENCVLIVIGYSDADLVEADKHIWVCDGAEKQTITSKALLWNGEWDTVVEYRYYNHFNWGQCGDQNGYFYDGVFEYKQNLNTYNYDHNVKYLKITKL
ncbi:MAG: hypothetical protein HDT09_00510 [Bacteroidales bacterium]|nr:hypothetical protein [Bacteroidales bacterium]